ncbi:MAG TPA: methionyl-tRNA formyltransferase [Alphaproteobacteria bacterium]|jgi:methionyl-tRNA formyltransferase|nr:methionyl-tRNA formyltransferase [Alphaproteobacteria bacterium]
MKIVFFGTPDYVMPVLTSLHKKFVTGPGKSPIVAVVTQSPKPVGRKQVLSYSPVDKWAHDHKIDTYYQSSELIDNKVVADIGVLASYGEIISQDVINMFPHGILVIHPSLLPEYRGASPITAAIRDGKTTTGVTTILMDAKVDHGKIVSQFKEDINPDDTTEILRARLFQRSAEVILEFIEPYMKGKITPKVQDETKVTYTKIIKKEDGFVDLEKDDPIEIERKLRAYQPWPGIYTFLANEKRLKILKAHIEDGKLILDEVQMEGKTPVSYKQFKEAYKVDLI